MEKLVGIPGITPKRICEANSAGENRSFILELVSNLFHFIILSLSM